MRSTDFLDQGPDLFRRPLRPVSLEVEVPRSVGESMRKSIVLADSLDRSAPRPNYVQATRAPFTLPEPPVSDWDVNHLR